ncbi:hypothetical protein LPJ78_004940 [Coemansia sp. RSA 989]|nr:armadillo-type protein [Coemansia mojavensis]KAJ1743125.1 hypothetical protein LPJ68_001244 [Coemansia sp. RSA 1086]KAJ1862098.1 hypothetical protein LPJ78_004940 [Coemansia sp. RSA 989]KAJ2674678.1 hypothetical protein IWW42_001524 [Coemansia sp. RSA 1085]
MDIVPLVSTIAKCVEPGSATRTSLQTHLSQLSVSIQQLKAANVEANSLLTHITLVAARLLSRLVKLSERERESVLQCIKEALTPDKRKQRQLQNVHAVIVDHLSRILVPLFVLESSHMDGFPEPTRLLAIECWRKLAQISTVYIPEIHFQKGPEQPTPGTVAFNEYVVKYLPLDYISLTVCALLDNSEVSTDQQLRLYALETLTEILCPDQLLDNGKLAEMFPGMASALTRIALAQLPAQLRGSAIRKPILAVRKQALQALEKAVLAVYRGEPETHSLNTSSMAEDWAEQARKDMKSIVDTSDASNPNGDEQDRFQQLLWRLAGLRHTEGLHSALFSLFAQVSSEECKIPAGGFQVALETCLAIGGAYPDVSTNYMASLQLRCSKSDDLTSSCVENVLDPLLQQFTRYVVDGEPQQRADVLHVVSGCIQALGRQRALSVVSSWWHSQGLRSLLQSLSITLPGTSLLVLESQSSADNQLITDNAADKDVDYILESYRSSELKQALHSFIQAMADLFTARELCSQLLSVLFDCSDMQVPALWMLRRVARVVGNENLDPIYPSIFQYCVDYCNTASEPTELQQHAAHQLMVLDVISAYVPKLGPNVVYYMDTLLFPLLQTNMASSPVLQKQARKTLDVLAQQISSTVAQMLKDNVDYIVEGCSQQVRSVSLHPQVFSILSGAVQLVGQDILVYMDDVVEDTLDVCEQLAYEDENIVASALQFLEIVTRTVAASSHTTKAIEQTNKVFEQDPDPIASAIKEIEDATAAKMLEDMVLSDTAVDDAVAATAHDEPDTFNDEDKQPQGDPLAIKIVLATQSFLYADTSAQQLLALKIVHNCVNALTDSRDLLPLLNELWPALVNRLNQQRDEFYVTLAACDVIEQVCMKGESWMRKRVKDDLWVHFKQLLTHMPLRMQKTQVELMRRVLRTLKTVVRYVPLDESVAWELCVQSVRFFGTDVEEELIAMLQDMVPVYGDKIWLVLAKLGCIAELSPKDIPDFKLPRNVKVPPGICTVLQV